MARGQNIPPLILRIIIEQHENGVPMAQIGRDLKLNRQTIHRAIRRAAEKAKADG